MTPNSEITDENSINSPEEQSSENERTHPIDKTLAIYLKHIESLVDTLPLAMLIIEATRRARKKEFNDFLKENCKPSSTEGKFEVKTSDLPDVARLQSKVEKIELANQIIPNSLLVTLVSQYDSFLGDLIKALYELKPEILKSSEKYLTYTQLVEFETLEDAKQYIIEKEIETLLRESHSDQLVWIANKFKIKIEPADYLKSIFFEVTERRNLLVHNSGVVSNSYITNCKKHGIVLGEGQVLGDKLEVTPQYFKEAHSCFYELGVQLSQVLWRKLTPNTSEEADASIVNIIFELLKEKKYSLAARISDFAHSHINRYSDDRTRRIVIINRAQAYKWLKKPEICKEILEKEDWSATGNDFQLIHAVLTDNFELANKLVKITAATEEITMHSYRDWPCFIQFRKDPKFQEIFKEVFGEELNIVRASTKPGSEILEKKS